MENGMRGIGDTARDSGLSVSALRFYDGAGVLVPGRVDLVTGYRWYTPAQVEEARLLAALRRARMPLADIRLVLAGWSGRDAGLVGDLLAAHLRRMENALSDARVQLSAVRSLIARNARSTQKENPMTETALPAGPVTVTVQTPALAAALDAVRFAVSADPELPVLNGVLFEAGVAGEEALNLVASDRYRLAVAAVPTAGPARCPVRAVVPAPLADAARALLTGDEPVRLVLAGGRVEIGAGGRQVTGECLDQEFPDYRRLVAVPQGRRLAVATAALRADAEAHPVDGDEPGRPLTVLAVGADGTLQVCPDGDPSSCGAGERVAVNREFLCQALDAAGADRLVLEYGGPTAPLVLRPAGATGRLSLLMPVRQTA
ncbi:DNA polymerase III subunit beta family protein [Streptantibioticus silvisoli]|uniref:MerR family transcriptional regulator n=1 Tax=Streptantibioticus silvisoli TaxID=2705255 RepID=A0ABT6VVN4_9ACTN|nr:MerR family transcriptional regulator [Streptantibioticus silvisoli]MDI5962542.1 MerR family transcriptional regulator [Streptantibioticus silvisoli]